MLQLLSSAREVAEILYPFERPFIVDSSEFVRCFGGDATPDDEGIRTTVDRYRSGSTR